MNFKVWDFDLHLGLNDHDVPTVEMEIEGTDVNAWVEVLYLSHDTWCACDFGTCLDKDFRREIEITIYKKINGSDSVAPEGFYHLLNFDETKIRNLIKGK